MSKLLTLFLGLVSLMLMSCADPSTAENKPVGPPADEEGNMPWNRPTGPEGGGPLGGLLNQ